MGWIDPPWLKLHRQICDQYEEIAFSDHAKNPEVDIDIKGVVARVLQKELRMTAADAHIMTDDLYDGFLNFPVRSAIEESLQREKSDISDKDVDAIFLALKAKFLDTQYEHIFFVYFVISYLLAAGDYGITRGDYFMKIGRNAIPDDKSLSRLCKLTKRFASFRAAEEKGKPTKGRSIFGALFWSFRKSIRLKKIINTLVVEPENAETSMRLLAEGGMEAIMPRLKEVERAEKQLFALIREDPVTSSLLKDQNVSDDALANLYNKLIRTAPGSFARGHWIPVSSLAYGQTLAFALKHQYDDYKQFRNVCNRLQQYFLSNETGEIEE